MRVIKGKVHQPYEVKGSSIFYAFSYYFDRAVESGLIGECCVHTQQWPLPPGITIILLHRVTMQMTQAAFLSFFFLCPVDGSRGGALEVRDFKKRAKEGESSTPSSSSSDSTSSVQTIAFRHILLHVKTQQDLKPFQKEHLQPHKK